MKKFFNFVLKFVLVSSVLGGVVFIAGKKYIDSLTK